jgi:hypothetical protein
MLPIQTVMLTALFVALIPALIQLDILPAGTNGLEWKRKRKKKEPPKD